DGALLATLGEATASLWDTATASELAALRHDTRRPQDRAGYPLNALAISPDGRLLATAAGEIGRVYLWNVRRALSPEVLSARGRETATAMLAALRTSDTPINSYIAALGPHAKAAVPILLGALNDPEVKIRGAVVMALSSFPSEAGTVVPVLSSALLRERHIQVRAGIVACLAQWGEAAKPAIPSLLQIVEKDENSQVRLLARRALQQMAPDALAKLDTELKSRPAPAEPDVQAKAKTNYEGMPLDYWIEKFGESNIPNEIFGRSPRSGPLQAIRSFAPSVVVPALTNALGSEKQHVRAGAAELLGTYGAEAGSAIPVLCRALGNDSWETRRRASDSLVIISKALGVVPTALRTILDNGTPDNRIYAARTLAQLEPTNEVVPRAIAEALRQLRANDRGWASPDLYDEAARALVNLGPRAKVAVPELLLSLPVFMNFMDFQQVTNATRIIAQTGVDSNMVPVLLGVLRSLPSQGAFTDPKTAAIEGLVIRDIGPPAIPILIDELKKNSPTNRMGYYPGQRRPEMNLLVGFGATAVPAMTELLQQPEERFSRDALSVIQQIGPAAKEAVPALGALLKSGSPSLQRRALAALAAIGPASQAAIPAITPLLSDPNPQTRSSATNALMRIRVEGRPARL
ncbi:MAG: HEAT repeat domain-containing protein, partial [Methylococcaceae bacterium]|nr:HEAT repeat domain-containing protein [Methylococcaceae bacterium]